MLHKDEMREDPLPRKHGEILVRHIYMKSEGDGPPGWPLEGGVPGDTTRVQGPFWALTDLNQWAPDDLWAHAALDSAKSVYLKLTQNTLLMVTTAKSGVVIV